MTSRVAREGRVVRRPLMPWSESIHGLLRFLEDAEFPAPRVVGVDGEFELLTWIDGESGPHGWSTVISDDGLRSWAAFLRRYHDVVRAYRPSDALVWSSGAASCADGDVICHGDFGPWNAVWDGDHVVGLIDWDHARPASPLFDVAYALEYVAPFRDDVTARDWMRHPTSPDRRRRIATFCDGYGMSVPDNIVDLVSGQQELVRQTVATLARDGVEPQTTWVAEGYLDVLQERIDWTRSVDL